MKAKKDPRHSPYNWLTTLSLEKRDNKLSPATSQKLFNRFLTLWKMSKRTTKRSLNLLQAVRLLKVDVVKL